MSLICAHPVLVSQCVHVFVCEVNVDVCRETSSVGGECVAARITGAVLTQVQQSAASWAVWRTTEERDVDPRAWRVTTSDSRPSATNSVDLSTGARSSVTAPRRPVVRPQSQSCCLLTSSLLHWPICVVIRHTSHMSNTAFPRLRECPGISFVKIFRLGKPWKTMLVLESRVNLSQRSCAVLQNDLGPEKSSNSS